MPTINEKNLAKRSDGTYGNAQFGDYTAQGLLSYRYSGMGGELPTCLITRDPDNPTHWVIRNVEDNPIMGCSGSFGGNGSGSRSAEKRWKDYCYAKAHKKPIEELTS